MQTQTKVKDKTNLTIPDDLSIPAFLRRVYTKKEEQENKERRLQLRTGTLRPSLPPPTERPKDPLVEQFRIEEEERHRTKANTRIAKMLERKQVKELPPGSRWDTRRGKWVVDPYLLNLSKPKVAKPLMSRVVVAPRVPLQAATRKPGLISTIVELISRPSGASVDEVLKAVAERFPGRVTKANTVSYHAKCHATSTAEDQKRGKVFYKAN